MIRRQIDIDVRLTPREAAEVFSEMDSVQQSIFFNEIWEIWEQNSRPFCFQLQALTDSNFLKDGGRQIMEAIGEYARPLK